MKTENSPWNTVMARSLSEALEKGHAVYFTGQMCPNGHTSTTRVIDGKCSSCYAEEQSLKKFGDQTRTTYMAANLRDLAMRREIQAATAEVWDECPT